MRHFDESKVKRSGDGTFAEKERSHSKVRLAAGGEHMPTHEITTTSKLYSDGLARMHARGEHRFCDHEA